MECSRDRSHPRPENNSQHIQEDSYYIKYFLTQWYETRNLTERTRNITERKVGKEQTHATKNQWVNEEIKK